MLTVLNTCVLLLLVVIGLIAWRQFRLQRTCADELTSLQETLGVQTDERANLVRQLNHSVKNNLQLIVSLMNMQARRMGEGDSHSDGAQTIREMQARIETMAMIHKELYRSGDYRSVCAVTLFNDVTSRALLRTHQEVDVTIDVDRAFVDYEIALPLGLIAQELVTNAIEHGLSGTTTPRLRVAFKNMAANWVLEVADNGAGLAGDFDLMEASTLGLTLVRDLALQTDAQFGVRKDDDAAGAQFECILPMTGITPLGPE